VELGKEFPRIERRWRFRDFRETLSFVARDGEVAEAEGHHPDIGLGWGYAAVSLHTKKINGLRDNDFIVAAKNDHLLKEADERPDQAIAMTFHASDPIAVGRPTHRARTPCAARSRHGCPQEEDLAERPGLAVRERAARRRTAATRESRARPCRA
jgi:pterin-4a-carbinolamine dehydratase